MKRTQLSAEELKALRAVPCHAEAPNRVRVAMAILDLTQRELAAGTQLTQATVSDIVNFKIVDAKLSTLRALARFFGCAIDDLFPACGLDLAPADQLKLLPQRKVSA